MNAPHPNTSDAAEDKLVRRWIIVAFTSYALIMAGCLALAARGHAADATAGYVAPLDMTSAYAEDVMGYPVMASSYAEDAMGYPVVLSQTASQRSPNAETTGVDSTRHAADLAAQAAQATEALVENGWDFTNPANIFGFGPMPQPDIASDETIRMTARRSE